MKDITFLGDSLGTVREFPEDVKKDAGYQLGKVQEENMPDDFKSMPSIGSGVYEIRIWDDTGAFRVIYTAKFKDTVFVLHAFQKKTQKTSQRDIEICKNRYKDLVRSLNHGK
ncbi:MAG: hypothetical protein CVU35_01585 [Betaproteobacteria bacterium HGW-Betaproteobacteria-8]|nr:MAG: hypothetical protein CVU35_01585 [Betaproteobacteria bacterium HGW-Betaproteobacteria-8]